MIKKRNEKWKKNECSEAKDINLRFFIIWIRIINLLHHSKREAQQMKITFCPVQQAGQSESESKLPCLLTVKHLREEVWKEREKEEKTALWGEKSFFSCRTIKGTNYVIQATWPPSIPFFLSFISELHNDIWTEWPHGPSGEWCRTGGQAHLPHPGPVFHQERRGCSGVGKNFFLLHYFSLSVHWC